MLVPGRGNIRVLQDLDGFGPLQEIVGRNDNWVVEVRVLQVNVIVLPVVIDSPKAKFRALQKLDDVPGFNVPGLGRAQMR